MRTSTLVWRSLTHFRAESLAILAGVAVGAAVLTGALMVGDSISGSLRGLVMERLGPVDHLVTGARFFNASLPDRLAADEAFRSEFEGCAAAIVVRGSAGDEEGRARASRVDIFGIREKGEKGEKGVRPPNVKGSDPFFPFFDVALQPGTCVLNDALAETLQAEVGQTILLRVPTSPAVPRSAALGRRDRTANAMRLTVTRIVSRPGPLRSFSLHGNQRVPRNAWVALEDLQEAVERLGRANALLVAARPAAEDEAGAQRLAEHLHRAATLDDYDLVLRRYPSSGVASLETRGLFLSDAVSAAAQSAAADLNLTPRRVLVYLANTIAIEAPAGAERPIRSIPYSIVAGIDSLPDGPIAADEVVLNQWAAEDLKARPGDGIRLVYAVRQPNGEVVEVGQGGSATRLRLGRIIPTAGLGADPTLTPPFKGITDAATVSRWDPPPDFRRFFRLERIGPRDEAYWQKHRAAPKAFVNLETAQRLWGSTLGRLTAVRIPIEAADEFERRLRQRLEPASVGLVVRPIRAEQLASASGSTDFGQLFVGFSLFLIVSAALLVGLLFRLAMERRARQIGLMLSLGFTPRSVRRIHLAGGMLLAVLGGLLGLLAAVGYAWLMLAGLRTWWLGAVGSPFAHLHVQPVTLALGCFASLAVSYVAIRWAAHQIGRTEASVLLAGGFRTVGRARGVAGRVAAAVAGVCAAAAGGLLILASGRVISAAAGFFSAGVLLLAALVGGLVVYLGSVGRFRLSMRGRWALERLGARNAGRHPTRSVLTAGLIAAAAFVIVTVAAMRQGEPGDTLRRDSGAGGFNLVLEADIPLQHDLAIKSAREALALADIPDPVAFVALRASEGEDISCLNLFRPNRPRIVGVPDELIERGGFAFAAQEKGVRPLNVRGSDPFFQEGRADNPWALLRGGAAAEVPVIADAATAQWILHVRLGETLTVTDESGAEQRLRLVALLKGSIFQGDLLMSTGHFARLFPSQTGFKTVLVRADPRDAVDASAVKRALERDLADFGVVVDRTADRLALFAAVADTYLATFQTLGGLGLVLGTVGLGVVLLRGLFERRGELAILSALGFRRRAVTRAVLAENAFLLLIGVAAGTGSALIAVAPQVASGASAVNWPSLVATLVGIAAVGVLVLTAAVAAGLRAITVADLRAE